MGSSEASESADGSDPVLQRFIRRFDSEVMERVGTELQSGRLFDEGRARSSIRKDLDKIFQNSLEHSPQSQLLLYCGKRLLDSGEYPLAKECLQRLTNGPTSASSDTDLFRVNIEARLGVIACDYAEVTAQRNFLIAPKRISRLLECLNKGREVLNDILSRPSRVQEELAWLILNTCKIMYDIGQPLIWLDCAKYVCDSIVFSSMAMDAVINLCTTRHLTFKMKLWTSAFLCLVLHNQYEEVNNFVSHVEKEVNELRKREELDPPLQENINSELVRAETDISMMKKVMNFWNDPDSFSLSDESPEFAEKCLIECIRCQDITAGNINEPWRKRTFCILKSFMSFSSQFMSNNAQDNDANLEQISNELSSISVNCLAHVMSLVMFGEFEGDVDSEDVLSRVRLLRSDVVSVEVNVSGSDYDLLETLVSYMSTADEDNSSSEHLIRLLSTMNEIVHSNEFHLRQSFMRKLCLSLWSKRIYPTLQNLLSLSKNYITQPCDKVFNVVEPLFTAAVTLMSSGYEDPILLGGISVVIAQLLKFLGETRKSISFLTKALECIDAHRAARVDVSLHFPSDCLDIKALQYSSFSCESDNAHQWHAAAKRLGAHAFAGYGIFGSASTMEPVDQALCDIHIDVLSLLFRFELSLAICSRNNKALVEKGTARPDEQERVDGRTGNEMYKTSNVDKLSCVAYLRSSWGKSTYARSILWVEMARAETVEEKRRDYLKEAIASLNEAEKRECNLQNELNDLSVVSASSRHPLVLARSHSFFYVCPVGHNKLNWEKISYFRVFGREEGSGTDISITSDELAGCDTLVKTADMISPTQCAVRISSVRPGEKYSFACAAFDKDGNLVGSISPTSQSIEAANPLPIVSLWGLVCLLAYDIEELDICKKIAARISDSYLKMSKPIQENRSFGKGINLFSFDRYFLNALKVQQASLVQLSLFVKCFLAAEEQFVESIRKNSLVDSTTLEIYAVKLHWQYKASEQRKIATRCHNLALVTTVACMCKDHDLVVRCVCLGYTLISQSLLFDIFQMAQVLQNPILTFITALKVIPRSNWEPLHHKLFCRLLMYSVKCAVINGNASSLASVLADIYSQEQDNKLSSEVLEEYDSLFNTIRTKFSLFATSNVLDQMSAALSLSNDTDILDNDNIWNLPACVGRALMRESALDVADGNSGSATASKLEEQLQDMPPLVSQLLDFLVCSCLQLFENKKFAKVVAFLSKFPIRVDVLSSAVSEDCIKWGVEFLCEPLVKDEEKVVEENQAVENCALSPDPQEIYSQFRGMARLTCLLADSSYASVKGRNDSPESDDGPYLQLSEDALSSIVEGGQEGTEGSTPKENINDNDDNYNDENGQSLKAVKERYDFVKRSATAVILFARSFQFQSAVDRVVRLWNFIIDQWSNPRSFARDFSGLGNHLLGVVQSVVHMLEVQCGEVGAVETSHPHNAFHPRIVKQNLFLLKHPLAFVVKTLCLLRLHSEVVQVGIQLLTLYVNHGQEYSNTVCDHCMQYLLFSQEEIIKKNAENMLLREKKLEGFVTAWEEAQAKKRKKKLRIVKVEKTDEELRFEAERASLNDKLERSKTALEFSQQKKNTLLQLEKRIDGANTTAQQLFDKIRKSSASFILECRSQLPEGSEDFASLLENNKTTLKKFNDIVSHFDQVATFLREKKDTVNLVSCLHEEGDFCFLFGAMEKSRNIWRDGIDGYFNALDAWQDWHQFSCNDENAEAIITVISILAKLSKHCSVNQMDAKSNYCQLAAKLILSLFRCSLNHPVDLHGFAAYSCVELGGHLSLEFDCDTYSAFSFHNSLEEIVRVLGNEKLHLISLPVLVLLEHFHAVYTNHLRLWLETRLCRVRFLAELHYFSEATSMLSAIIPSLEMIRQNCFSDLSARCSPSEDGNALSREVMSNGFEFEKCPPFYNNLTAEHDLNQKSLSWVASFPKVFEETSKSFKTLSPYSSDQPSSPRNEEEKQAEKKKGKGKKSDPVEESKEEKDDSQDCIFTAMNHADVYVSCALILLNLASMDERSSVDHHEALSRASTFAHDLIEHTSSLLKSDSVVEVSSWNNSQWVRIFGQCRVLHMDLMILRRDYKACRFNCLELLKQLSVVSGVHPSSRAHLTHVWFCTKFALARIAECQARFSDLLSICSQSSAEASQVTCGFWWRRFCYYQAVGRFKQGDIVRSEKCCSDVMLSFEAAKICDVDSVRCKLLKASVLHAKMHISSLSTAESLTLECADLLRTAVNDSYKLSKEKGFVGDDSNLTYEPSTSSILKHDQYTPFVYGITSMHSNHPAMTPANGTLKSSGSEDVSSAVLRPGPIDQSSVHSASEMSNIYLEEVKSLVLSQTTLCIMLDEIRSSTGFSSLSMTQILQEQVLAGEACLKTLRHVAYPPPAVKPSLFLSVGKSRARQATVDCFDGKFPGCHDFMEALLTGLQACIEGPHQWCLMKLYCLEIVECYGDQSLNLELEPSARLKMAVCFLLLASRLDGMYFDVQHNILKVIKETSLIDATCSSDIEGILKSISSSSLVNQTKTKEDPSSAGKAASKSKGTSESSTPNDKPLARDAFLLLSSLCRENNPFLLDSADTVFLYDLLKSIRSSFPAANNKLFLDRMPRVEDDVVVAACSVTCVWAPRQSERKNAPGNEKKEQSSLYPYLTGYFVLGGVKEPEEGISSGITSEDPFLHKISVRKSVIDSIRNELVRLKRQICNVSYSHPENECQLIAEDFCGVLVEVLREVHGTDENNEDSFQFRYVPGEAPQSSYISMVRREKSFCDINLTPETFQQYIDIFSIEKSCCQLNCDKNVSLFFWNIFRC